MAASQEPFTLRVTAVNSPTTTDARVSARRLRSLCELSLRLSRHFTKRAAEPVYRSIGRYQRSKHGASLKMASFAGRLFPVANGALFVRKRLASNVTVRSSFSSVVARGLIYKISYDLS